MPMTSKEDFILNLNKYRNTFSYSLNKAKVNYKNIIANQVKKLPQLHFVDIWFVLYPATAHEMDTHNICSVHEKFLLDAIVNHGRLEDDNYKFTHWSHYGFGEICRDDPRVDVFIKDSPNGEKIRTYPSFIKG